jgi:hypothetical protein
MTPVRAFIAGVLALVMLGAGAFIVASAAGAEPHDLVPLLGFDRASAALLCFLAAWGAIIFGALGVIASFLAFIEREEVDDLRRRGFPKGLPVLLIALSLTLAWYALRCAAQPAPDPIAVPVAPTPAPEPLAAPLEPEKPQPVVEAPSPTVSGAASSFEWRFKDPLIRDQGPLWSGADAAPFANEPEARALLCGKAWVAVTGSASEEGPAERNERRARIRAENAAAAARDYLARNPDCGETPVFALSLGQHAPTGAAGEDGAATAYQRQMFVISRLRASADEVLSRAEARAELTEFLAASAPSTILGERRFSSAPVIIEP